MFYFDFTTESFPAILGLPEITPTHFGDVVDLRCSFRGLESREGTTKGYTVTWFKVRRQIVLSSNHNAGPAAIFTF